MYTTQMHDAAHSHPCSISSLNKILMIGHHAQEPFGECDFERELRRGRSIALGDITATREVESVVLQQLTRQQPKHNSVGDRISIVFKSDEKIVKLHL